MKWRTSGFLIGLSTPSKLNSTIASHLIIHQRDETEFYHHYRNTNYIVSLLSAIPLANIFQLIVLYLENWNLESCNTPSTGLTYDSRKTVISYGIWIPESHRNSTKLSGISSFTLQTDIGKTAMFPLWDLFITDMRWGERTAMEIEIEIEIIEIRVICSVSRRSKHYYLSAMWIVTNLFWVS